MERRNSIVPGTPGQEPGRAPGCAGRSAMVRERAWRSPASSSLAAGLNDFGGHRDERQGPPTTELIGYLYRTASIGGRGRQRRHAARLAGRRRRPGGHRGSRGIESGPRTPTTSPSVRSSSTSPRTTSIATGRSRTTWRRSCASSPTRNTTSPSTTARPGSFQGRDPRLRLPGPRLPRRGGGGGSRL